MEQSNMPSTKGKGLGMAGMIIGIVALVWACIPYVGAGGIYLAVPGLILSAVAFFMAKGGGNPNKGGIITGVVLNLVALLLAIFWIYKAMQLITDFNGAADQMNDALKSLQDSLNAH
jgi:hypothetical protein